MGNDEKQTNKDKLSSTAIALIAAITTAVITGYISYSTAKYQLEKQAAITLSFAKEQFDVRLNEYPKLWQTLLPISSRSPVELTPQKCQAISQELNQWLYGKGGLVAHEYTRSLVIQLRDACGDWKSGERPKSISELKHAIIYSCRNDLYLVARKDTEISTLNKLIEKRNIEIEKLQEKARVFK
ncbi:MAG: hypothetical protein HY938_02970 [Nitrosomonadales bacterium]|nr:hypothetical protein [Nitrosomonadales bacterium]